MFQRSLPAETIRVLMSSPLWRNLCSDPELHPEIRTDAITVYYRGGALLKELRVEDGSLRADLHHKFIPLRQSRVSAYIRLAGTGEGGLDFAESLAPLPLGNGDPLVLGAFKALMDQVLTDFPEAKIVHAICCRPENQIIDQEITFQESGQGRDKIDLCHFDYGLGKLAFAEVKRKSDARLLERNGRPEVLDQLEGYGRRLRDHRGEILDAYRRVVRWKRELGLAGRLSRLPEGGPSDLLENPILVIGSCTSEDVRRIKAGEGEWAPLMAGLKDLAAGLILCGKDGCRLSLEKGTQTVSYLA